MKPVPGEVICVFPDAFVILNKVIVVPKVYSAIFNEKTGHECKSIP